MLNYKALMLQTKVCSETEYLNLSVLKPSITSTPICSVVSQFLERIGLDLEGEHWDLDEISF